MKTIQEILSVGDPYQIYSLLTARKKPLKKPLEVTEREYDPNCHLIFDTQYRKDKIVKTPTDKKDENGNIVYKTEVRHRCRVAVPCQRVIIERSVGFLFTIPVTYNIKGEADEMQAKLFDEVLNILEDNKEEYFNKKLSRCLFRACECAELWYIATNEDNEKEMRVKLLSPLYGDKLYPHYDNYDKMDGFAREYVLKDETGAQTHCFDVYTSSTLYKFASDEREAGLTLRSAKPHGFTKIPLVYYMQEETEWEVVQKTIERLENSISDWGDTNDYFGSPTYFFKGRMKGFADKGEVGRVYQGDNETDMKVVSWDSAPESRRMEIANLINIIFSYTQTPDISFENMKTLGNNTSGAAIRLMFIDPHLKAGQKIETFGEMFTRRFNIIKNGYSTSIKAMPKNDVDRLRVKPRFTPYIPKNDAETLQLINSSTGGKATMSQEEGIRQNPLVSNPEEILKQIKQENIEENKQNTFGSYE
jgi:SPP1 family phage portal protein